MLRHCASSAAKSNVRVSNGAAQARSISDTAHESLPRKVHRILAYTIVMLVLTYDRGAFIRGFMP